MATATIIGHNNFEGNQEWKDLLTREIVKLIESYNVDRFLVETKSSFTRFCSDIVRELKGQFPFVKLVHVWGEYLYYNDTVDKINLRFFDELLRPECFIGAGKNIYVKRNQYLIDSSDIILFYFNDNAEDRWASRKGELPHKVSSGTRIAYEYALKKKKKIINVYKNQPLG